MAPILSTAVGITPQIIDDPRLQQLLKDLNEFEPKNVAYQNNKPQSADDVVAPLDITKLVSTLEPYQKWIFEEQVDLHEWINALNAIDASLAYFIQKYPCLLLIGPVKRKRGRGTFGGHQQFLSHPAESLEDLASVSNGVTEAIKIFLRFLSGLLRNSSSKAVFNSVEELADLLAAADDTIAALALEALCNLATPPSLHKQQSPEVNQHTTGLHSSKSASHRRLIALARGWGTRGSGLGLYACVTADDSEFGQGSLPPQAGNLEFTFSPAEGDTSAMQEAVETDNSFADDSDYHLVRIQLSADEIIDDESTPNAASDDVEMVDSENGTVEASKKRRKVGPNGSKTKFTKSTAELFFLCLEKAGGRNNVPEERLFALLADIRLAGAFYCSATRVEGVELRLRALITILHSHPSQEIMSGYFQAQPELCVELIDLLKPTVSSANVPANPAQTTTTLSQDALGAISSSPNVPYGVRMLAVEALTALVARRDGTSGALTGAARHSSVLNELGVGKGQYLGLLPTLIRYSLASLGSSLSAMQASDSAKQKSTGLKSESEASLDVGLAFVEATIAPAAPRIVQVEKALEFIDSVLTLTSAIVSTPTGTSALTDCGLIPALLTTAATDSQAFIDRTLPNIASYTKEQILRVKSLLRFITAQAIQILEGAIVTHNNALSAFHDLQGVEVLTSRLSKEVTETRKISGLEGKRLDTMEVEPTSEPTDVDMDSESFEGGPQKRILSSQRVLLFSIVTCLTVVFHQESTSSSASAPSGGAQLRKPELTQALIDIMNDVNSYGGHLASLIATLLSDVLNGDPHVVHHVHESGVAKSFLNMLSGKRVISSAGVETFEPVIPPVPELIMALPNVISALALTEDGAKAVKEANPFPSLLKLFHHPNYAMPKSRCLLNEMTAIVGTGLDEVMRHVQMLKPLVLKAIADALHEIVVFASGLTQRKEGKLLPGNLTGTATSIENEKSCLMQYVLNFGQLLEQILHNEDHCEPFVTAGGLDALLELFPLVMPDGHQFLSHVSSLSCPSVSTLHHSTVEESLCLAFKCIALRYDPSRLIKKTTGILTLHMSELEDAQVKLKEITASQPSGTEIVRIDAGFVLEGVPTKPLHEMNLESEQNIVNALSRYLRSVSNVQWATSLLGTAIKTACQRGQESSASLSRAEREWKKELSSKPFEDIVSKLANFHQSAIFEVCRVRSLDEFEKRERNRAVAGRDENLRYMLRIVCAEGAVVRDGIEIDSCASVGSMEMGEIAVAFDRCVNSSGILRYRTPRGWVSEMTRGHGREPIAEVISFWRNDVPLVEETSLNSTSGNKRRIEAPIPDMCTVSASVLARVQTSYSEFFNALSKTVVQGIRSLPATNLSFQEGEAGSHVSAMMRILTSNIQKGFDRREVATVTGTSSGGPIEGVTSACVSMYLGCILSQLQACLFEEKRERRMVNVPLLLFLMESDVGSAEASSTENPSNVSLLNAVRFIFQQSLNDFEARAKNCSTDMSSDNHGKPFQRVDRTVAASLPPAISLLRRLMSGPLISSSPASSILSRIKRSDLGLLLGRDVKGSGFKKSDNEDALFSPEGFVKSLHFAVSEVVRETWVDPRFAFSPPHIVHPFATLVCDIITGLEDASKKRQSLQSRTRSDNGSQWDLLYRGAAQGRRGEEGQPGSAVPQEEFEPSEEAIAQLREMGFNRDHALDALETTRSNRVEVAMEYALSHPPPSPTTIERQRAQREERRRRREQQQSRATDQNAEDADRGNVPVAVGAIEGSSADDDQGLETMDTESGERGGVREEKEKSSGTQEAKKREEAKDNEDDEYARAKLFLDAWIKDAPKVSCTVLQSLETHVPVQDDDEKRSDIEASTNVEGDGEREALTVVLCSFLLDICQRYPEESDNIVSDVLRLLKSQVERSPHGQVFVRKGNEASFAALCHAAVLFTRALPKTRVLVLKENLVVTIVSCIQTSLKSSNTISCPTWLAAAILLLDVMAQPVVAFSDKKPENDEEVLSGREWTEYDKVREDHKKQALELTDMAAKIFAATNNNKNAVKVAREGNSKVTHNGQLHPKNDTIDTDAQAAGHESDGRSPIEEAFAAVPAYYPLLPSELIDLCVEICFDLLRRGKGGSGSIPLTSPGVIHAVLLLFLRLLRSPKMSTHCLQKGAAEMILSLSHECRFTGNSGLVTLIFRRLLEDDATLQAAMETEIRGTISKLHGKHNTESENETSRIPQPAFTQAITPLLCRDPVSFLKAFILSAKIETREEPVVVSLLSSEERAHNLKALSDIIQVKKPIATPAKEGSAKEKTRRRSASVPRQRRGLDVHTKNNKRSKSPSHRTPSTKRSHSSKKHKRDKHGEKNDENHTSALNGTPANHIVSLLVTHIISSCNESFEKGTSWMDQFPDNESFLWTANLLEILADLVLAVPACASAVQKFRWTRSKDRTAFEHALAGCPAPPKTFLSFLLHRILPQDRWSIKNDQQIWEKTKDEESQESEAIIAKKKMAFRLNKVSQTAARLLVALVARPGDGRKRVIAELTYALSGGRLGHAATNAAKTEELRKTMFSARELHALQAWGELCIGLASPRSNGKNPEGNSSLSFEVIKLMLEHGMAHALLFAIHRVRLHHPMAASTCSSLLLPFEILSRGSVTDGVQALADKEMSDKGMGNGEIADKTDSPFEEGKTHEHVGTSENAMLEEAFHHEAALEEAEHAADHSEFEAANDYDGGGDENEHEVANNEDVNMDEEIDDEGSADDDMSSSSESEESSDENESDEDSEGEEDEEDDDEDTASIVDDEDGSEAASSDAMEIDDTGDWDVNAYGEEAGIEHLEFEDGDEDDVTGNEPGLDEGWTRIESSGFGGMLMGGRRHGISVNNGPLTSRTRGFIDAAEAMIGTLLRTGEIHGDALAEIEGSLGIRIMSNGRTIRTLGGSEGADNIFADTMAARLGGSDRQNGDNRGRNDVVGTLPHVHQRNQPGAGYSALSSGGRWIETSSMEYVYGGPSVTAGSRNYDLVSPSQTEPEIDPYPNMTQAEFQLFPGGPASAAHARTQHSLHPLLCGIDLPPMNALVSDLLPHGVRSTRRGQMTTRGPGEWTNSSLSAGNYLVLTSNGNVIRSNRANSGAPLSLVSPNSRSISGPVGWTDDGLPFDSTAAQFSSAFENALQNSMDALRSTNDAERSATEDAGIGAGEGQADITAAQANNSASDGAEDARGHTVTANGNNAGEGPADIAYESEAAPAGAADGSYQAPVGEAAAEDVPVEDQQQNRNASTDGDGVASSLAAGLRLSPSTDASVTSAVDIEAGHSEGAPSGDAHMEDSSAREQGRPDEESTDMDAQPESESTGQGRLGEANQSSSQPEQAEAATQSGQANEPNSHGLVCPPDIDEEVFNSLPVDMQRDCIEQHRATQDLASQLGAGSSLDPEALAALPPEIRREVMEQEQNERRAREAPADPSNAEEMDNASFLVSLAPDLREEILLTADEQFLNSLPASIIAEAQILRERAAAQHRRIYDEGAAAPAREGGNDGRSSAGGHGSRSQAARDNTENGANSSGRRKSRSGKIRVEKDRDKLLYFPPGSSLTPALAKSDFKALLRLLYLLAPVRPARLLQKVFQNLCSNPNLREVLATVFVKLLHEDDLGALAALDSMSSEYADEDGGWRQMIDRMFPETEFPPKHLLGVAPEVLDIEAFNPNITLLRRKQGSSTAAAIAANLPASAAGSQHERHLPPVVANRVVDSLLHLCKNSPRFCLHSLINDVSAQRQRPTNHIITCFEKLLDLLEKPRVLKSSANLEQLLTLLEACVSPLSHLSNHGEDTTDLSQRDIDTAAAAGKEWMDVPRVVVSQERLQLLCSILRMETCRDASFTKVNTIVRRLCRVDANRGYVLAELASVAHALGADAIRDLKALRIRMEGAVAQQRAQDSLDEVEGGDQTAHVKPGCSSRSASSSVTLSTSTSELKLLRVLQTLQALCGDSSDDQSTKKNEAGAFVTEELVHLLRAMKLDDLWDELSSCLRVVQVLEGVSSFKDEEDDKSAEGVAGAEDNDDGSRDGGASAGKKLKNSAAGMLTRFLPTIEAFFVANASATRDVGVSKSKNEEGEGEISSDNASAEAASASGEKTAIQNQILSSTTDDDVGLEKLVGGRRLVKFVVTNRVLLNALVRNNPGLLDKGLRGLVQVPRCRVYLDFDVKRQWFKTQVRRLRQHASRRHGSLRLHIRRRHVFEDSYHQLRLRNADEMRGRLHITFRNEEGVDAGGLSREFFGILAKEIFNPDYALFTSTEDGCTFQPNPNSSINPDHLSYFRFVGRIVGKAVADGFLLDAHFTRSLYKHMLGMKPTHHDMEAIDPDYYRNLKTILEFKLEDIGLDLTFSIEDHSFGRSQVIDLIPNGRNIPVTEERKAEYVSLVCQHRMTTAISSQIKSYLDGFYELVSPELIAIFNPRELELLISGLPDIDVNDLKKNTDYVGWKATDKEIEWFWDVMFSLSRNEKAAFLQFVTGSSKVPLAGFSELQGMRGVQKFSIHKQAGTNGALMSAHTCFNSLDLPVYKSEEELREKLLYAINEGVGAFLFA